MTEQALWSPSSSIIGPEQIPNISTAFDVNAATQKGLLYTFTAQRDGGIDGVAFYCSYIANGAAFGVELLDTPVPVVTTNTFAPAVDCAYNNSFGQSGSEYGGFSGSDTTDMWDYVENVDHTTAIRCYSTYGIDNSYWAGRPNAGALTFAAGTDRIATVGVRSHHRCVAAIGSTGQLLRIGGTHYSVGEKSAPPKTSGFEEYTKTSSLDPSTNTLWTPSTVNVLDDDANHGFGVYMANIPDGVPVIAFAELQVATVPENRLGYDIDLTWTSGEHTAGRWIKVAFDSPATVVEGTTYYLLFWALGASYKIPYFSMLTNNAWGGVTESCSMLTDTAGKQSGVIASKSTLASPGMLPVILYYDAITSVSAANVGTKATFTKAGHDVEVGDIIVVSSFAAETNYNGTWEVDAVLGNDFNAELDAAPGGTDSGGSVVVIDTMSSPWAEVDAVTVDTDNTRETTLTFTIGSTVTMLTVPLRSESSSAPDAPLTIGLYTATGGGGTERATVTISPTLEELSTVWVDVSASFAPFVTADELLYVYFESAASAGRGWQIAIADTRSDADAGSSNAPTVDEVEKSGWTGTRDDAGNDNALGDDRYDGLVRVVVPPKFYDPYEAFLKGLNSTGGLWFLDDQSGTNCVDESGNGNDGTYQNSPTLGVDGPLGGVVEPSWAVEFDSSSSHFVSVPNDAALEPGTSDFSIAFWAWFDSPATTTYVFGQTVGGTNALACGINNVDDLFVRINGTTYATSATSDDVADDNWHRVVINCDRSGNADFYVDGSLIESEDISAQSAVSLGDGTNYDIAANGNSGTMYNGRLAFVQFRTALWDTDDIATDWAFATDLTLVTPTSQTTVTRG